MNRFNPGSQKGFSLIELMIVVAIIGILAAVATPAYIRHVYRTRQAEGVHRILDIKTAQEKIYALNDQYFTADPLSGAGAEIRGQLNFDVTDTGIHNFAVTSADTTREFRVEAFSDLNGDGSAEMCWVLTEGDTTPIRLDNADTANALGNNCDSSENAEELKFSTLFF